MPGVPGLWTPEQASGWKRVVDAVHEKGGYIYCQLWHAGRVTIPQMTGLPPVAPSAMPWDSPTERYSHPPVGASLQPLYVDHPPIELSVDHIKQTIEDYRRAARTAMDIGFDGVEIHGGKDICRNSSCCQTPTSVLMNMAGHPRSDAGSSWNSCTRLRSPSVSKTCRSGCRLLDCSTKHVVNSVWRPGRICVAS